MSETVIRKAKLEVRGNLSKLFSDTKSGEIMADGPAGTGKTRVFLERQHLITSKYPGTRGLITRKFRSSMNETCLQVLNQDVFRDKEGRIYDDAPLWRERDQKYMYDNGSQIVVAGMDDPTKVMSSQYDWAYVNEAIELKQDEWEAIMSRLRNGHVPYQQMLGDTNPGPPTHWILQREKDKRLKRYPTSHKDNPVYWDIHRKKWTQRGEAYVNGILRDGLTGLRRVRLYDGEWRAAEGLVYDMFDPDVHIVDRFDVPRHWPRYWVFDFGYVDPFVWLEIVEDVDSGGILYLHRELYHTGLTVADAAQFIKSISPGITPYTLVCDHDAEDRATLEQNLGMLTIPAFKFIRPGIAVVQHRLKGTRFGGKPGFFIMRDCGVRTDPKLRERHKPLGTADEFPSYQWDTGKITLDKYKDLPIDKDNHGMDAVRYALSFIDDASIDPQDYTGVVHTNPFIDDDYVDPEEEAEFDYFTRISRW